VGDTSTKAAREVEDDAQANVDENQPTLPEE
jgi:hypothetical protein